MFSCTAFSVLQRRKAARGSVLLAQTLPRSSKASVCIERLYIRVMYVPSAFRGLDDGCNEMDLVLQQEEKLVIFAV